MRRTAGTRLAVRVLAGTGRSGALRVAVLVVATALAVAATLTVAFVPVIATHRADAARARAVRQVVPGTRERFQARSLDTSIGDRPLRRTYIDAGGSAPAPPGVRAAPGPGEVYASPALAARLRTEPLAASFVPGRVIGTVTAAGLADPGELFAYIGVAEGEALQPASGFGAPGEAPGTGTGLITIQLLLFVLVPAGGFVVVSATLSSRARSRRWDALRSLSVPEGAIRHVAGVETGLTSLVGGALGLALFAAARPLLTGGGVGGLRWFPGDLRLTPVVAVTTLVAVAGAGTLLGRRAAREAPVDSLHGTPSRVAPALRWLPLLCGATVLATIGIVHGAGRIVNSAPLFLAGALLAAVGLGLVLLPIVRSAGTLVAARAGALAWRLGGSRAAYEPRSLVRVLAGLVALTVVGYVNFAVLTDLRLVVGDQRDQVVATTAISDRTAAEIDQILDAGSMSVAVTSTIGRGPDGATIAYATCPTLDALATFAAPCQRGGVYRVADRAFPSDLTVGHQYQIPTRSGAPLPVTAPATQVVDRLGLLGTSTLVIADAPPTQEVAIAEARFLVDRSRLLGLQSAIDGIDPRLVVDSNVEPEQIERYERHLAIARLGTVLGAVLATLTFLVASIDRLLERRSHTATLAAIGVPRRLLRTSQIVQLVVPLGGALVGANVVGWLVAQGYLAYGGLLPGTPYGLLGRGAVLSSALILIAAAVGAVVSIPKDLITHLRAE